MTHLALGVWCDNTMTREKRSLKKSIRDGNLKREHQPIILQSNYFNFLMTEFSKLESIYSNNSEIVSGYF